MNTMMLFQKSKNSDGFTNVRNGRKRYSAGFTLVELMVVISIIGILAALLLTNFNSARQRTRDAARKADLRQIKSALRLYYNDYQQYPDNGGSGNAQIMGCGAAGVTACTWGGEFSAGPAGSVTIYMKQLPVDPTNATVGSDDYIFKYTLDPDGSGSTEHFYLETYLENEADEDAIKSQVRCDSAVTSMTDTDAVAKRYLVCED